MMLVVMLLWLPALALPSNLFAELTKERLLLPLIDSAVQPIPPSGQKFPRLKHSQIDSEIRTPSSVPALQPRCMEV